MLALSSNMAPARRALVLALLIAGLLQPTANGSSSASTAYQAARSFLRSLSTDATQQRHGHSMQHGHAHAHGSQGLAINLSTSVNVFLEALKDCPAGCEQWGNCNRETGTCECPWGRTGSACEVDQLSHCYVSANKTTPSCGLYVPKNCECYQQCFNMYCVPPSGSTAHYVVRPRVLGGWKGLRRMACPRHGPLYCVCGCFKPTKDFKGRRGRLGGRGVLRGSVTCSAESSG